MTNFRRTAEIQEFLLRALAADTDDCIIWPFTKNAEGYAIIGSHSGRQRVSRMVCTEKYGEPADENTLALHSLQCYSTSCINWRHLYWGTSKENMQDAIDAGTAYFPFRDGGKNQFFGPENGRWGDFGRGGAKGELQGNSIFTENHVHWIRHQLELGYRIPRINEALQVSYHSVYFVATGRNWGWLPVQDPYIKIWADINELTANHGRSATEEGSAYARTTGVETAGA